MAISIFLRQMILNLTPKLVLDAFYEKKRKFEYRKWEKAGKPIPPPHAVKKTAIREYQTTYGYRILIETGTYYGAMIYAQLNYFDLIYSIELSKELYEKATKRFKKYNKVHLYHGDSATELGNIMKDIVEPVIFWLDGHYSGGETAKGKKECPIMDELEHILSQSQPHIILIDDARCFIGENDYPTIEELQQYLTKKKINHSFEVKDDIIRITLNN
ncbi:MAG: hypothetical protein LBQ65_06090 [Tannerellaceae bacterium]|jgi:hypothetical protein|nr:hypothetical protein [Tannerellaceae bacterium]